MTFLGHSFQPLTLADMEMLQDYLGHYPQRGDGIESDISVTDEGIVVVQTSADPEVVAALQTHAAEVSDMVARCMR